ncbi:MAG: arylsulfatase [Spirochaetales bacterium]|nr:arylsulfatase [Spirochaetales bacterium]
MNKTPNIIFIFCDDLGWGDVSCLSPDSRIQTPHIDALAQSGMSFTDAHAGSSVCTPSRYTLLTGRYCWRTRLKRGVNGGYSPALLHPDRMTVASMLAEIGYTSACIGKWHIGMDWTLKKNTAGEFPQELSREELKFDELVDFSKPIKNGPVDVGFNYYFGISASLDMSPYVFIENDRATTVPTEHIPKGETPESRARAGIGAAGWRHEDVLPALEHKSVDFVREQTGRGNPFFLYVPVNGPHTPVVPNEPFIGKSDCGTYGDFVMEIDQTVGNIVQAVKDAGVYDETMIFFSSDNGPETLTAAYREQFNHFSSWKFRGMKRDNWEGGHRIPFIVSWPGVVEAGVQNQQFVELADFTATVAEITSTELPDDAAEDSYSMLPLLRGKNATGYREFSVHHSVSGKWAIRRAKWKLLLHSGSGGNAYDCPENNDPVQLYDMETDPYETTNVYGSHADVVKELKALCLKSIREGRSTPGASQDNDPDGDWVQLRELIELRV